MEDGPFRIIPGHTQTVQLSRFGGNCPASRSDLDLSSIRKKLPNHVIDDLYLLQYSPRVRIFHNIGCNHIMPNLATKHTHCLEGIGFANFVEKGGSGLLVCIIYVLSYHPATCKSGHNSMSHKLERQTSACREAKRFAQ